MREPFPIFCGHRILQESPQMAFRLQPWPDRRQRLLAVSICLAPAIKVTLLSSLTGYLSRRVAFVEERTVVLSILLVAIVPSLAEACAAWP